jgi:hypothetical protein
MEHFLEKAADGRIPLQTVPTDLDVLERGAAFTEKCGYEFASSRNRICGPICPPHSAL